MKLILAIILTGLTQFSLLSQDSKLFIRTNLGVSKINTNIENEGVLSGALKSKAFWKPSIHIGTYYCHKISSPISFQIGAAYNRVSSISKNQVNEGISPNITFAPIFFKERKVEIDYLSFPFQIYFSKRNSSLSVGYRLSSTLGRNVSISNLMVSELPSLEHGVLLEFSHKLNDIIEFNITYHHGLSDVITSIPKSKVRQVVCGFNYTCFTKN